MSLGITFTVSRDAITPVVKRFGGALKPERLNPILGRSAVNTTREHLFGLNLTRPNQLGGRRTNFYAGAARGTNFQATDEGVTVSIVQVGIAQRYYGGTIRPKTAKFLTIPVNPAAYGKRAREFDLELVFGPGGEPVALATKGNRGVSITQNKRGQIVKKQTGRHGEIMFRLVRSVTQKPDPTVLPYPELMAERIKKDVGSYFERVLARNNGGAS